MRRDGKRGGSTKGKRWMEKQVGERISEEKKIVHIYIYKFLLSWLKKYVDKVNEEVA